MEIKKSILIQIIKGLNAYVQNIGFDYNEILDKFKELKGVEPTDNGFEVSNEELCVILNRIIDNGEVIGVYNYPNNFNRDQKELNIIKRKYESELESKGYTIIEHCEWHPHFNEDKLNKMINERNYLTNIIEQKKLNKQEVEKLEIKKLEIIEEIKEANGEFKDMRLKIKDANNEFEDIQLKIKDAKDELDKIIERYKKGKICIEEQRNILPQDIKDLNNKIDNLKNEYDQLEVQYKQKCDEYNNQLNIKKNEIFGLNVEKNFLKADISTLIQTKEQLEKQNNEINEQINKYKKIEYAVDNKRKFIAVCKMYKLQNWKLPDFEIETAKNTGINDEEISNIINEFYKQ